MRHMYNATVAERLVSAHSRLRCQSSVGAFLNGPYARTLGVFLCRRTHFAIVQLEQNELTFLEPRRVTGLIGFAEAQERRLTL